MVLEPDQRSPPAGLQLAAQHHVADHPRRPRRGLEIDQADSRHLVALVTAVDVAQQLIAAAHAEHGRTAGDRCRQVAGPQQQVRGDQPLVAVLAAAQVVEVGVGERIAGPAAVDPARDAPPLAAVREHRHVAPVGVDVQVLGVQVADSKLHAASQYGRTRPRSSSSLRRSSMAVYVARR